LPVIFLSTWNTALLAKTNLNILKQQLLELSRTPYFSASLDKYVRSLIDIVDILLTHFDKIPIQASRNIIEHLWIATRFLIGSTTKQIPYEIVYCLKSALSNWNTRKCLITTALLDELNFFFLINDPTKIIKLFLGIDLSEGLIQIALPRLYRHKPLYTVPLYHELGHFIDQEFNITKIALLQHEELRKKHTQPHLAEFFADLFSSCYTGFANRTFLSEIAPDNPDSQTHPSTKSRLALMQSFLSREDTEITNCLNKTLSNLTLPNLTIKHTTPDIFSDFSNIRPYDIRSAEELHGIMAAGWNFLINIQKKPAKSWQNFTDEFETERIVNDLVEKSIRNYMIKQKWMANGTS